MDSVILQDKRFDVIISRLSHELIERHGNFDDCALIGLQPRGIYLLDDILLRLKDINRSIEVPYGYLDATFYRDDFRRRDKPILPNKMQMPFSIEGKHVVLFDDVLYTGRTVRAALDALLDYGRPSAVELLVLVDRRYSRELPIEADYTGITVDTRINQYVAVTWKTAGEQNAVKLITNQTAS